MTRHLRSRTQQSGFTLLELLVAFALMSLLMLGMVSALSGMAQTEERVDRGIHRDDQARTVRAFVSDLLGQVSVTKMQQGPGQPEDVYFEATSDSIQWLGVMPGRHGVGGRHFFRLLVEQDGSRSHLVLRYAPFGDNKGWPNWGEAPSRVLVEDVEQWGLTYEDTRSQPLLWLSDWTVESRLPSRLQLQLKANGKSWPLWVVPLRPLPASNNANRVVIGGSR